jgi:hypothetical protein
MAAVAVVTLPLLDRPIVGIGIALSVTAILLVVPEVLVAALIHLHASSQLEPRESVHLRSDESLIFDCPVYYQHDILPGGVFVAHLNLTSQRIILSPPRRSRWRSAAIWLAHIFFIKRYVPGYHKGRSEFALDDVTLVRPAVAMFQVGFDGWSLTPLRDQFPWWDEKSAEARKALGDEIQKAVAAVHHVVLTDSG